MLSSSENCLDALDFALGFMARDIWEDDGVLWEADERMDFLDGLFQDAVVNWQVAGSEGDLYLIHRVLPEQQDHYERVASPEDRCSELLHDAWRLAYGRQGDADGAWRAAFKAVEVLLHPIVEPANAKATLGGMRKMVSDHPERFSSPFPLGRRSSGEGNVEQFVKLLDLVAYEPGRHGGTDVAGPTLDAARCMVNLSVSICQMLRDGVLVKNP